MAIPPRLGSLPVQQSRAGRPLAEAETEAPLPDLSARAGGRGPSVPQRGNVRRQSRCGNVNPLREILSRWFSMSL